MEDNSWQYSETMKRCITFLENECAVIPNVHDLANYLFEQGHITFNERKDVYSTPVVRDKMHLLTIILIKRKPFAIEAAYNCLIHHLRANQYYNLADKLENTLKEVKKLPEAPERNILEKVVYLKDNINEEPIREIRRCLEEVAEYIIQSQTVDEFSGQAAASTESQTPDEAFTSLLQACEENDVQRVQQIIRESPECINNINQKGQSALMVACSNSTDEIVRLLLSCDNIKANLKDVDGHSALMNSAMRGDIEVLCAMLDSDKVDVSVVDDTGLTYLWYLFGSEIPTHLLIMALMIQNSSKIIDEWKVLEVDLLMYLSKIKDLKKAIKWENIVDVVKRLLSHRKVNQTDLLKLCLTIGNPESLAPILASGQVEICSDIQKYCYAVTSVNPEVLDVLCQFGFINMSNLHRVEVEAIMESTIHSNDRDLCGSVYGRVRLWKVNDALKTALFLQSIAPGSLPVVLEGDKHDLNQQDPSGTSVFAIICKYGHHGTVSELLKVPHINFNVRNKSGQSPFMVSLMNSDKDVPKLLWESDSVDIDVNLCDIYSTSTLAYVCVSCNQDMAKAMLSCPTLNVNLQDDKGYTALSYVCLSGMHHVAAGLVNMDIVLLEKLSKICTPLITSTTAPIDSLSAELEKIDLNECSLKDMLVQPNRISTLAPVISGCIKYKNNQIALMLLSVDNINLRVCDVMGNTLLMLACLWGDEIIVSHLIPSKDIDLNAENASGATAFTLACIGNNVHVVHRLLEHHIDIDKPDRFGLTPLMHSCFSCDSEIPSLLISKGANVNATNNYGISVLMCASLYGTTNKVDVLLRNGADIDAKYISGNGALLCNCLFGKTEMVKLLLSRNVPVHAKENEISALMAVCSICGNGSADIVEVLLSNGIVVDHRDSHQKTALFYACSSKSNDAVMTIRKLLGLIYSSADNCKIVQQLLTYHADVNAIDEMGQTPLLRACFHDKPDIVAILLSNHANINKSNKTGKTPLMAASIQGNVNIIEQLLTLKADVNAVSASGDTALLCACGWNNINITRLLLQAKADITKANNNGLTPLKIVCFNGYREILELLVTYNVDVNATDDMGHTALHFACFSEKTEVVESLLSANANPNVANKMRMTPLMSVCYKGDAKLFNLLNSNAGANMGSDGDVLVTEHRDEIRNFAAAMLGEKADDITAKLKGVKLPTSYEGNLEILQLLLSNKADVNMAFIDGGTALHMACSNIHINVEIVDRLLEAKADINKRNFLGYTPLMIACNEGNVAIVKLLVSKNAEVNQVIDAGDSEIMQRFTGRLTGTTEILQGVTPLLLACATGNVEIVDILLANNAHVNAVDAEGDTPLIVASLEGNVDVVNTLLLNNANVNMTNEDGATALFASCQKDDNVNIVELLLQAGADVNCRDQKGITPLILSCGKGHINTVRVLLDNKGDVNIADPSGTTVLIAACLGTNIDIIKLVLQAGAEVNKANIYGVNALIVSCELNNTEIVELLLDYDADVNVVDSMGLTPLKYARRADNEVIEALLWSKGATE